MRDGDALGVADDVESIDDDIGGRSCSAVEGNGIPGGTGLVYRGVLSRIGLIGDVAA